MLKKTNIILVNLKISVGCVGFGSKNTSKKKSFLKKNKKNKNQNLFQRVKSVENPTPLHEF
jgi:hypothetical protein